MAVDVPLPRKFDNRVSIKEAGDIFAGLSAPTSISNAGKLAAIEREIKFRRRVYARYVSLGKMHMHDAIAQIEIMLAIREDYRVRVEQGSLAL